MIRARGVAAESRITLMEETYERFHARTIGSPSNIGFSAVIRSFWQTALAVGRRSAVASRLRLEARELFQHRRPDELKVTHLDHAKTSSGLRRHGKRVQAVLWQFADSSMPEAVGGGFDRYDGVWSSRLIVCRDRAPGLRVDDGEFRRIR